MLNLAGTGSAPTSRLSIKNKPIKVNKIKAE
jgi:hypothetical protein